MAIPKLDADLTKDELQKIIQECQLRLQLINKYSDVFITNLKAARPELAELSPLIIRSLLDVLSKLGP
jgi:hypothetical protein